MPYPHNVGKDCDTTGEMPHSQGLLLTQVLFLASVWQLTDICDSSSRESYTLIWPLGASSGTIVVYMYTRRQNSYTEKIKIDRLFCLSGKRTTNHHEKALEISVDSALCLPSERPGQSRRGSHGGAVRLRTSVLRPAPSCATKGTTDHPICSNGMMKKAIMFSRFL